MPPMRQDGAQAPSICAPQQSLAEQLGDVDHLARGLGELDAALHGEGPKRGERLLLAEAAMLHEDALRPLDDLALLELGACLLVRPPQPLLALEALHRDAHDR